MRLLLPFFVFWWDKSCHIFGYSRICTSTLSLSVCLHFSGKSLCVTVFPLCMCGIPLYLCFNVIHELNILSLKHLSVAFRHKHHRVLSQLAVKVPSAYRDQGGLQADEKDRRQIKQMVTASERRDQISVFQSLSSGVWSSKYFCKWWTKKKQKNKTQKTEFSQSYCYLLMLPHTHSV